MRKHTGMRPHDIAVLVKVLTYHGIPWYIKDLAYEMQISQSEFSESLNRSWYAGLLDDRKQKVMVNNFYEFLVYGFRFVFPQRPGELTRGVPTAHSHPEFRKIFLSDAKYVWPDPDSKEMGFAIEPFYSKQTKAVQSDKELYRILSLIEILRVGKTREMNYAKTELKKIFELG